MKIIRTRYGLLSVLFQPRHCWIGVYVSEDKFGFGTRAIYVSLVPMIVFQFLISGRLKQCLTPINKT